MIPIFRRIRRQLADDNRPLKYMRYAFGEIVLVVIGILIALQINDWNTVRKNRIREAAFVSQLAADLQTSTVDLKEIMIYFSDNAIACGRVVHAFYKPSLQRDFNANYFFIPWSNQRYIPVMGTAKALISSGNIDLIKSKELRASIVSYLEKIDASLADIGRYEESYYRRGIEGLDRQVYMYNLRAIRMKKTNYKYSKELPDLNRAVLPIPDDLEVIPFPFTVEDMFKKESVLHAYTNLLTAHRNTYQEYKNILNATEELLQLIQDEGYQVKMEDLSENKALVFDSTDLQIIIRADSILSDETKWNNKDDRDCIDDVREGRYSLYCALYKASFDITNEYEHERPVMQQVRFIIDSYEQNRVINHRLMDWNNHPETNFLEVKQILKETTAIIKAQLNGKE